MQGDNLVYDRKEYGNPSFSIKVAGVYTDWFMTCMACPEQYDVFIGEDQVGYVRLRGGALRAAYPNVYGKYEYNHHFQGDGWKGEFDDEDERKFHLDLVAKHLYNRYLESNKKRCYGMLE